ncbi:hypothetical protein RN001_012832 [Aquatica leii]|uniref:Tetraspanin n=1 Tax=Aquatica leii TaxID=1421715 RepID=A0AAN7Q204_9COLE|nr:hypothetical protein RN001_012832 [Aquatica leii]
MKDILEGKEMNKGKRLQTKQLSVEKLKRNLYHNPGPSDDNKENSHKRIKIQREKAKKVQYKEHEDDDLDDFEGSDNEVTEDICIICSEFGKNNKMWIRCCMVCNYKMTENSDLGLKCLKYMLLVSNLMFMSVGILLILMGDTVVSIYDDFEIFLETHYFSPALFMISIGAIILLVSLYGCVGAVLHSTLTINVYTLLMCILLILEIAASITAFAKRHDIDTFISDSMYNSMNFFKNDTEVADSWNYIQKEFVCCGVHSIKDWSDYNITEIMVQGLTFGIPKSCCRYASCTDAFSKGCWDYISSMISESGFLLGTSAIFVAIIQFLGIAFGNMLAKTIRRVKSKEEMLRQERNMLYDKINDGKSTLYE